MCFRMMMLGLSCALLLGACQQGLNQPITEDPAQEPSDPASVQNIRNLVRTNPAETVRILSARSVSDPAMLNDLGVALDMLDRHQEAQAVYQKALLLRPGMASATNNLALSLSLSKADGEPPQRSGNKR